MQKIVIFDFCETLVDFQTADAFVDYALSHLDKPSLRYRRSVNNLLCQLRILDIAEILTHWKKSLHKRNKLWILKGIKMSDLEKIALQYYESQIKKHFIQTTLTIMKKHQERGEKIWIVSGGYDIYLKHFVKDFGVEKLISSKISSTNGICDGKMEGLDCLCENKIILLKNIISKEASIEIIASYSDSISDIPILNIAQNAYVVSRKHQSWVNNYNYKEILWK